MEWSKVKSIQINIRHEDYKKYMQTSDRCDTLPNGSSFQGRVKNITIKNLILEQQV